MADDRLRDDSGDAAILDEARSRFKRASDWESEFRKLYVEDVKFANADTDNGWQWPDHVKRDRDLNNRPSLTINKVKPIVVSLANEARQNRPQAGVKPVGDRVSFAAAQVWEGLLRHVDYTSNAGSVYVAAKECQLEGGIGYWRVAHDYVDETSFDQEIRISPLDPMGVYLDCDIQPGSTGVDSMWGFVFEEWDREEFKRQFPGVDLPPPSKSTTLDERESWVRSDAVRVAEYYRILLRQDTLLYIEDSTGRIWTGFKSLVPAEWRDQLPLYKAGKIGSMYRDREVKTRNLQWYKISGAVITERRIDLKGKYIPIVRLPGRERKIEGRLYRAGLVRALKDAQRMYNYNTSGEVEVVALQTKTPWVTPAAAIEGNETAWNNANRDNAAYLPYRHVDEDGNPIPPPTRPEPPTPAQGFLEGLRIAAAELEMASGVAQAQQQQPTIERTPRALQMRERMGNLVNYDFTDSELQAVRHTAIICIDLAPHIYDTRRVVQTMAKDRTISEISIDPDAPDAHARQEPQGPGDPVKILFNPKIGKYAVEADVGPAFQTQRQETWNAFVEILSSAPELMNVFGDLGFLAADFPMADEIAERIRRNIENTAPWLVKDGQVGPVVQKLQADLTNSQQQVAELLEKLTEARIKTKSRAELRDIEVEDAMTRRLAAEGNVVTDFAKLGDSIPELKLLIRKTLADMLGMGLRDVESALGPELAGDSGEG
jgi:hypothetical protein